MTQKKIERNALIVSSVTNFIIAFSGIFVYCITGLQALFLDGVFSLIAFVSTILAAVVSRISRIKTKAYPDGLHFLEPLYAIFKALLILLLLGVSIAETGRTAYAYFAYGEGELMNIDPVVPYSICMVIMCFGLSLFNRHQNKRINNTSTILAAESKGNFVDGLQTLGIGIAAVLLFFVDPDSSLGFLWYTGDFFITLFLVIVSVREPVVIIFNSFREISGGITGDRELINYINGAADEFISPVAEKNRREIVKTGMYIDVKILLDEEITHDMYAALLTAKEDMHANIKQKYENIRISFEF